MLFEQARAKLDKIDTEARKEKKQIVNDLAKNLEGRIPTDTISIEIVNQLRGRVSERFIHECLDEKYKQERRVENARKQKKRQEQEGDENLAALAPLNNEEAKNKKEATIHDTHGRYVDEEDNPKLFPTSYNAVIDDNTVATKASSQTPGLQDESNQVLRECSKCKELYFENLELKEAVEKSTQLITADNLSYGCSSSTNFSRTNSINILQSDDEDKTYHIPKGKHDLLIAAMQNSREFCSVTFDKNGIFVHAEPDVSREMTND